MSSSEYFSSLNFNTAATNYFLVGQSSNSKLLDFKSAGDLMSKKSMSYWTSEFILELLSLAELAKLISDSCFARVEIFGGFALGETLGDALGETV